MLMMLPGGQRCSYGIVLKNITTFIDFILLLAHESMYTLTTHYLDHHNPITYIRHTITVERCIGTITVDVTASWNFLHLRYTDLRSTRVFTCNSARFSYWSSPQIPVLCPWRCSTEDEVVPRSPERPSPTADASQADPARSRPSTSATFYLTLSVSTVDHPWFSYILLNT